MLGGSVLWGYYACCKLFVGDAFQRRTPFTQLNENDFGFQTVSSRRKTAEGRGGEGVKKTSISGEIQRLYSPRKKDKSLMRPFTTNNFPKNITLTHLA